MRKSLDLRLGALFLRHQILHVAHSRKRALLSVLGSTLATVVAVGALSVKQAQNGLLIIQDLPL